MNFKPALLLAASLIALNAHADIVAQWDFEKKDTKHSFSQNGASFATVGSVTLDYFGGSKGSVAGLQTLNYGAAPGAIPSGVQFMIDTSGNENLVFSFDQRHTATSSAYTALLYTLDHGASWLQATTFFITKVDWVTSSYDFSSITGANNNAEFGLRLVSIGAPGTTSYVPTDSTKKYASGGAIRYDSVTLSGTAIPDVIPSPVPEASTVAMLLAGLGVLGVLARRRKA